MSSSEGEDYSDESNSTGAEGLFPNSLKKTGSLQENFDPSVFENKLVRSSTQGSLPISLQISQDPFGGVITSAVCKFHSMRAQNDPGDLEENEEVKEDLCKEDEKAKNESLQDEESKEDNSIEKGPTDIEFSKGKAKKFETKYVKIDPYLLFDDDEVDDVDQPSNMKNEKSEDEDNLDFDVSTLSVKDSELEKAIKSFTNHKITEASLTDLILKFQSKLTEADEARQKIGDQLIDTQNETSALKEINHQLNNSISDLKSQLDLQSEKLQEYESFKSLMGKESGTLYEGPQAFISYLAQRNDKLCQTFDSQIEQIQQATQQLTINSDRCNDKISQKCDTIAELVDKLQLSTVKESDNKSQELANSVKAIADKEKKIVKLTSEVQKLKAVKKYSDELLTTLKNESHSITQQLSQIDVRYQKAVKQNSNFTVEARRLRGCNSLTKYYFEQLVSILLSRFEEFLLSSSCEPVKRSLGKLKIASEYGDSEVEFLEEITLFVKKAIMLLLNDYREHHKKSREASDHHKKPREVSEHHKKSTENSGSKQLKSSCEYADRRRSIRARSREISKSRTKHIGV